MVLARGNISDFDESTWEEKKSEWSKFKENGRRKIEATNVGKSFKKFCHKKK